ncbi:hypothetical protein ACWDOP_27440 [Nocardia sp. NPDC003693]
MALTAAGSGQTRWAVLAGIICAATLLFGLTVMMTTVHRDRVDEHMIPSLLNDSWEKTPAFARERGLPASIEPHHAG